MTAGIYWWSTIHIRHVGRGSSMGFERTPLFGPLNDFMFTSKLHIISILSFETVPLVSLLLRITAVQTSLVAATVCEFVHGGPAGDQRGTRA